MAPGSLPAHLVPFLASPQTPNDAAVDALKEWILHRRVKGDTLFDVSVGLAELEDKTPPHLSSAFDRARYLTYVPPPSDLTPPMGPFPLARSASTATILHHLLSQPMPTIQHSREVILEFVLAREQKHREKKPGRGGKGTLGRDGFEDIARKLAEIEDGLRGSHQDSVSSSRSAYPSPVSANRQLDEPRKVGMMLVLALRMSMSYFTLKELGDQLLLLGISDAERALVQHIRRRVSGEGRYGVGKELEFVEQMVLPQRRTLRAAFRSAKSRTSLCERPYYPITLPAPSRSTVVKLLQTFNKEMEEGRLPSAFALGPSTPTHLSSPSADRSYFRRTAQSPSTPTFMANSPKTPLSSLPPPLQSPSIALPEDTNPIATYALELVAEFLTREKREYILKSKWAKSGRDQLSKDLGEIESSLCLASKNTPSQHAKILLPVFLVLRRTFALPPSPLPRSIVEPYLDVLPAPPDPDSVPFREPNAQTATASLYVNPRLGDAAATAVLEELVDHETEKIEGAGASPSELKEWLVEMINGVEKRFPDGSYAEVFATTKMGILNPRQKQPQPSLQVAPALKQPVHRRALSSAILPASPSPPMLAPPQRKHSRSISMPYGRNSADPASGDSSDGEAPAPPAKTGTTAIGATSPQQPAKIVTASHAQLPPLEMLSPISMIEHQSAGPSTAGPTSAGWWDVVSAIEPSNLPPWQEDGSVRHRSDSGRSSISSLPLPPGAEPAVVNDFGDMSALHISPPRQPASLGPPGPPTPPRQMPMPQRGLTFDTPPRPGRVESSERVGLQSAGPDVPPNFSRPSASPGLIVTTPSGPQIPSPATSSKPKLFGRSMTLSKKSKDKENANNSTITTPTTSGRPSADKDKVKNNPGKWNRDMVANIMGPPADRK